MNRDFPRDFSIGRVWRCDTSYRPPSDLDDFKVTLREAIFSVLIVGVLYSVGFLVAGAIQKGTDERNLKYRQAIQIKDSGEQLSHACNTDVGYAFVEGDFKTIDPVSFDGLDGKHLSIRRDKEKYTMHTRVENYTVSDGKGGVQTRTRVVTYWTWNVVKTDRKRANLISLCGNNYSTDAFRFDDIGTESHVKNTGFRTRDVFYYKPKDFRGTIFAELKEGGIHGKPSILKDRSIEWAYENYTSSCAVVVFWVFWWILIIAAVIGFVIIDNKWLEDCREK